jgi:hypothetical protein
LGPWTTPDEEQAPPEQLRLLAPLIVPRPVVTEPERLREAALASATAARVRTTASAETVKVFNMVVSIKCVGLRRYETMTGTLTGPRHRGLTGRQGLMSACHGLVTVCKRAAFALA